eukprot:4151569-Lingulodinium_polyedra.AAC.1
MFLELALARHASAIHSNHARVLFLSARRERGWPRRAVLNCSHNQVQARSMAMWPNFCRNA